MQGSCDQDNEPSGSIKFSETDVYLRRTGPHSLCVRHEVTLACVFVLIREGIQDHISYACVSNGFAIVCLSNTACA
jgi:hypothetical protein